MAQLESEYDSGASRETASVSEHATEVKPEDALSEKDIQQIAEEFTKPETEHGEVAKQESPDAHEATPAHGADHEEPAPAKTHEAAAHADKSDHESADKAEHHAEATEPKHEEPREVASDKGLVLKPSQPSQANPLIFAPSQKAAENLVHGKAPSENKPAPANPLPKELPVDVAAGTVGKYTVQISSHNTEDEAKTNALKLKEKGFSAFVVPANVKGKTWYRVSVGLFDKKDEAKQYRERLMKEAGVASAFIQQIAQ